MSKVVGEAVKGNKNFFQSINQSINLGGLLIEAEAGQLAFRPWSTRQQ
jgi:hypothetical protein